MSLTFDPSAPGPDWQRPWLPVPWLGGLVGESVISEAGRLIPVIGLFFTDRGISDLGEG